jgi:beta-1,4-mannosyl-glycoprotein beta-1,4-N-acetylglucosaminyltransferase
MIYQRGNSYEVILTGNTYQPSMELIVDLYSDDSKVGNMNLVPFDVTQSGSTYTYKFNIRPYEYYQNFVETEHYRYYYLNDMPLHNGDNWFYENFQRNAIAKGLFDANPEDIILVSDLDEIPNLNNKSYLNFDSAIFLQNFYYYKLNIFCYEGLKWKNKWPGTKSIKYRLFQSAQKTRELRVKKISFIRIDQKIKRIILEDGGWHFSYLMDPLQIKNKIMNFAHKEYKKFNKINHIRKMIKEKKDLFNRTNLKYKTVKIDNTYPYEIISNQKKYKKWIEQN